MDEDNGFEIDNIVKEGGWTAGGVGDEDPPVMQLPVAADDDSDDTTSEMDADERAATTAGGGRSAKKKMAIGLIASVALLAVVIGLGAGLGTKGSQGVTSAASGAMTMEDCLAQEEELFKTMSVDAVPTHTPTTYAPTTDTPTTDVPTGATTDTPTTYEPTASELDDEAEDAYEMHLPNFDVDRRGDNDGPVRRELRGESKEDVSGLVHKKMMKRLELESADSKQRVRKLQQCAQLLEGRNSASSKSSKPCSSKSGKSGSSSTGKSGKSGSSPTSTGKSDKSGTMSKSSKSDCVGPTSKPTTNPTPPATPPPTPPLTPPPTPPPTAPPISSRTDSPTSKPTQDVCLSKKTVTVEESAVIGGEESVGDNGGLANPEGAPLNTRVDETDAEKAQRLDGVIPEGFMMPQYDPVCDAKCFTDDVYEPLVDEPMALYNDIVYLIGQGFENPTDVSDGNNGVTNDRIGGMMIRMCFHDNTPVLENGAVKVEAPPQHVKDNIFIDPTDGKKKWSGNNRYMETSGADASVLICPEERYHPNNNYDDTASRVLEAFQKRNLPDGTSLKEKYDLSYSDLLNNGCIAAVIWAATNADVSLAPEQLLTENPFVYGRRDACHTVTSPENTTRLPLCGLSGILPGVQQDINIIDNFFIRRGFNAYLWLIQFFTHTMIDNMADNCPLQNLVCKATQDVADAVEYIDDDEVGNDLDYFEFFIARGTHTPFEFGEIIDDEAPNCDWTVDNKEKPWPMTQADCTISLDQAIKNNKTEMESAITYFHTEVTTLQKINVLLCSLRMMASNGLYPGGACNYVDDETIETEAPHYFGAYFVEEREG